jgi:hypothetical protein
MYLEWWEIFWLDIASECFFNMEGTDTICTDVSLSDTKHCQMAKVDPCLTCPGALRIPCELLKVYQGALWFCHSKYLSDHSTNEESRVFV